jgi:LEA14-like dessication related protein
MRRLWTVLCLALLLGGCALGPLRDPLQVNVAGVESLPGEGLEVRMLVKLRVQNPNDQPLDYDGVYIRLDVMDRTFATGVSSERGSVPRYGESVIAVPVTVSALRMVGQVMRLFSEGTPSSGKVRYRLEGKLDGVAFGSTRFESAGELALPE